MSEESISLHITFDVDRSPAIATYLAALCDLLVEELGCDVSVVTTAEAFLAMPAVAARELGKFQSLQQDDLHDVGDDHDMGEGHMKDMFDDGTTRRRGWYSPSGNYSASGYHGTGPTKRPLDVRGANKRAGEILKATDEDK